MKYVSILRGINVGGHKKIIMTELKSLYISLGFQNTQTYIQSGNVIFESEAQKEVDLIYRIEKAIEQKYKFKVPVMIRTNPEISDIIKNCPFGKIDPEKEGTKVLVTFLSAIPTKESANKIQRYVNAPEKMVIIGKEMYFYFPNGYGKTKLSNVLFERHLGVRATSRNWKTVIKLHELSA